MTNTPIIIVAGVLVFLGGVWVFLSGDQAEQMDGDMPAVENREAENGQNERTGSGSWGDTKDNGKPIVYQKNRILNYGQFTVQYDVWFEYAKVSSGETHVLRSALSTDGTRYRNRDGSVELTVVDGIGSLIRDGQVVASGELQNREAIEAMGPGSCMAVTDEVIEGCE